MNILRSHKLTLQEISSKSPYGCFVVVTKISDGSSLKGKRFVLAHVIRKGATHHEGKVGDCEKEVAGHMWSLVRL